MAKKNVKACWLAVPPKVTELRETSKQAVRSRIRKELNERYLNFHKRQSDMEKLIYQSQINAAANTIDKYRFINGEIGLNKLLYKELQSFKS